MKSEEEREKESRCCYDSLQYLVCRSPADQSGFKRSKKETAWVTKMRKGATGRRFLAPNKEGRRRRGLRDKWGVLGGGADSAEQWGSGGGCCGCVSILVWQTKAHQWRIMTEKLTQRWLAVAAGDRLRQGHARATWGDLKRKGELRRKAECHAHVPTHSHIKTSLPTRCTCCAFCCTIPQVSIVPSPGLRQ